MIIVHPSQPKVTITGKTASIPLAGAGIPSKNFNALPLSSVEADLTLKRASLTAMQTTNIIVMPHPKTLTLCSSQRYNMKAGAIPKLTMSARESSSAPNLELDSNILAMRPSIPSMIAEIVIAARASSHNAPNENRIEVRPTHNPKKVMRLGKNRAIGIDRVRTVINQVCVQSPQASYR